MSKIKQDLIQEIDAVIKANNIGAITGVLMNGILNDMTDTLYGSNFLFPADVSLTADDIGKLVMNDGSGTAKVYQLAPPNAEQLGQWIITPLDFSVFSGNNIIKITTQDFVVKVLRSDWLSGHPAPASVSDELGYIQSCLQAKSQLNHFSFNLSSNRTSLTIAETIYQSSVVTTTGFGDFPLITITDSVPVLPAAPAYFPLGKLQGVDGNQAIISCNLVQEYSLAVPGSMTVRNSLFNYIADESFAQSETVTNTMAQIIVPAANGTVTPFDVSIFKDVSGRLDNIFRWHFLGFAVGSTNTTVTVYNIPFASLIFSVIIKLSRAGVINLLT